MKTLTDDKVIQQIFEIAQGALSMGRLELTEDLVSVATAHEPSLELMGDAFRKRWQVHVSDHITDGGLVAAGSDVNGGFEEPGLPEFIERPNASEVIIPRTPLAVVIGVNRDDTLLFSCLLDELKFGFTSFQDMHQAVDFLKIVRADLVVCNTVGLVDGGADILARIRAAQNIPGAAPVPVVGITDQHMDNRPPPFSENEFTAYLAHPLSRKYTADLLGLLFA